MKCNQHRNTPVSGKFPGCSRQRPVLVMLVFFFLCAVFVTIGPVIAVDAENQTLAEHLMNKGDLCANNGDFTCTFAAYEAAHQADPENADILLWHGEYLAYAGNNTGALEKYNAALAIDPEYAEIWYEKGKVLDKLGRYFESGAYYDRAEELDSYYRVPLTDRFPLNVLIRNAAIIVVVAGFFLLGIYIYFNERKRQ